MRASTACTSPRRRPATSPRAPTEAHLDRLFEALAPAATGTRFASVAQRWHSLRTCVPHAALERLARLRGELDPDGLLVAPQLP